MLTRNCRQKSPDATEEEIVYFIREKARVISNNIVNRIAWFLVAVPKCFPGNARTSPEKPSVMVTAEQKISHDEIIAMAIDCAESPEYAKHEQRAQFVAELAELEREHPVEVRRIREHPETIRKETKP